MGSVETVQAMYDAFNAQDWVRFGTYVHDDVEWTNIALERTSNLEQLRSGYPAFFEAFPDVHVRIVSIFGDGPYVAVEWHARGTHTGPLLGEPPTGKVFERRGCSVAEVQNEKIVRYRDYFDRASQLRQLGLMHLV
ncbi:MAG: ester cyclase [Gaiellaceae bacterium]